MESGTINATTACRGVAPGRFIRVYISLNGTSPPPAARWLFNATSCNTDGCNDPALDACRLPTQLPLCAAGFQLIAPLGVCAPCPAGTYGANGIFCLPCPQGSTSALGSANCASSGGRVLTGPTGAAPQLLTARATVHGGLLLTADPWLVRSDGAGRAAPVQRGVHAAVDGVLGWFVPEGSGDSRPGQSGTRSAYAANATHPFLGAGLSGVLLRVTGATWQLLGAPTAAFAAATGGAVGAHALTFRTNGTTLLVPAGALRGGYVYAATATMSLRARLAGPLKGGYAPLPGVDGSWTAPFFAPTLLPASAYVHLPPQSAGLALTLTPQNGSALTTPFSLRAAAPLALAVDAAARDSDAPAVDEAVAVLLAGAPSLPSAAAANLARAAADAADAAASGALAATSAALAAAAANVSSPSQCVDVSALSQNRTFAPAWMGALFAQAATLSSAARAANAACPALEAAAARFAGAIAGNGAAPTVPAANATALSWSFRVVPDGGANATALALVGAALDSTAGGALSAATAAQAAAAAGAASGRATWLGAPLSSSNAPFVDGLLLPLPGNGSGAAGVSWALAYCVDAEGAVAVAGALVPLGGLPKLTSPSATTTFVNTAVAALTPASVTSNPAATLTMLGSLTGVLATAAANSVANASGPPAPDAAALRANNTALKDAMLATVSSAVDSLSASAASGAALSALASAALNISVVRGVAGVVVPSATDFNRDAFTASQILTLSQTTAVALDDSTAGSAISTMATLMGDGAERSGAASSTALSTLSTVLFFSLPTNVMLGLSNAAPAAGGNSTSDAGVSSQFTAGAATDAGAPPPSVPAFPPSTGAAALSVIASVMEQTASTAIENATFLRSGVAASLNILSAALLRAAAPGDPPINVTAGPSAAFSTTANASYCSTAALSMSTRRLDAASYRDRSEVVAISSPIAPCNGAAGAGALPPPAVSVPLSVIFSGSNASSRDVTIVQSASGSTPTANMSGPLSAAVSYASAIVQPRANGVYASLSDARAGTLALLRVPVDLLPDRGADSRVTAVKLGDSNGAAAVVRNAAANFSLVVPPASASAPSAAIAAAARANSRLVVAAVCPLNVSASANATSAAAVDEDGNPVYDAAAVVGGFPVGAMVTFVGQGVAVPLLANRSAALLALANATTSGAGALRVNITAQLLPAVRYYAPGGRVVVDAQWRLELDCGPFRRNFTCGLNGTGGQLTTLMCPPLIAAPTCGWWNESARGWSSAGCVATAHPVTGVVTCSCNHLTEFAARFESLAGSLKDEFDITPALANPALLQSYPYVIWLISSVMGCMAVALLLAAVLDKRGDAKFYESLASDEEVAFLRRIEHARGGEFVLDRHLDLSPTAPWAWGGSAVGKLTGELQRLAAEVAETLVGGRAAPASGGAAAAQSGALARIVGELSESPRAPSNPYTTALYFQLALRLESMRVSATRLTKGDLAAAGISTELAHEVVGGGGAGSGTEATGPVASPLQQPLKKGGTNDALTLREAPPRRASRAAVLPEETAVAVAAPARAASPPPLGFSTADPAALALQRCAALVDNVRDKLLLLDSAGKSKRRVTSAGGAGGAGGVEVEDVDASSCERFSALWGFFQRIWLLQLYLSHPKFSAL